MRRILIILSVMLAVTAISCATTQTPAPKGEVVKEAASTVTCKVVSVDLEKRLLTLKGPAGRVFEVEAGEEVRNLAQVNAGDDVVVKYYEAISAKLYKAGEAPAADKTIDVATRAEPGQKPAAFGAHDATITAEVTSIDQKMPSITLRGPQGNFVTVIIKDTKLLEKVKVGDQVVVNYKLSLAVSVEKPPAP